MWKQKIGISLGNSYGVPTTEVVRMVKQIGFDAISPVWCPKEELEAIVRTAEEEGLALQSMHAPFDQSAAMWSRDPAVAGPALQKLLAALADCVQYHIPVMVVHTWIGFEYTFDGDDLCYDQFDALVAEAAACGVTVAFENTEGEEYLFALMDRYKGNSAVASCWDSGHEMCYNHSQDLLAKFGDRLCMTHLNDNLGISRFDGRIYWTDDLHLLPWDGIADWDDNVQRLRNSRPLEYLNFELNIGSKPGRHENDVYGQMSLQVYFTEAYKRACRIAYRYAK